jgi:hypothetical protein
VWNLGVNEEEIKLEAWERKMLRKIFRGTRTEDGGWRRKIKWRDQRALQL